MKYNFLRKAKWYIVGFILVAIMLSVSLSFCAWDTLSAKARLASSGSGGYKDAYKIVEDANGNRLADVGDVVEFGNYYQDTNDIVKSPLKWIVADKRLNDVSNQYELSLVSKHVIAFGSFWGALYTKEKTWINYINGDYTNGETYQNYSESTVRAWLNFDGGNKYVRTDANTPFSLTSTDGVAFQGFYTHAFSGTEQGYIIPKTISGIVGGKKNMFGEVTLETEQYTTVTDKVWLPSASEIFGNDNIMWGDCKDGSPDKQFEYFKNDVSRIAKTTAFASSNLSNYTIAGLQSEWSGNWLNSKADSLTQWFLRSPRIASHRPTFVLGTGGIAADAYGYRTNDACFGIRPAIILPY